LGSRVEVKLPQWGMGMTEGTLTEWLKQVGDQVTEGEPLAKVEAAKVAAELESPETGKLTDIIVQAGATVEIYTTLAIIETD
jgi:pyruvate/2-oxoglutarate dehydrogenase complex dihydrolipoamide acyltransferase (E2) component